MNLGQTERKSAELTQEDRCLLCRPIATNVVSPSTKKSMVVSVSKFDRCWNTCARIESKERRILPKYIRTNPLSHWCLDSHKRGFFLVIHVGRNENTLKINIYGECKTRGDNLKDVKWWRRSIHKKMQPIPISLSTTTTLHWLRNVKRKTRENRNSSSWLCTTTTTANTQQQQSLRYVSNQRWGFWPALLPKKEVKEKEDLCDSSLTLNRIVCVCVCL